MKTFLSFILTTVVLFSSEKKSNAEIRILLYSNCPWYRHEVIPKGVENIKELALKHNWQLTIAEDSSVITKEALEKTDILIFNYTNGPILDNNQKKLVENFVESGKSILTIHSGTSTENEWPWYMNAISAKFIGHPPVQKGVMKIEKPDHQTMLSFPSPLWETKEEWFSFNRNPRNDVKVLASVDESTYNVDDNSMFKDAKQRMDDHPIIWYKKVGRGFVYQSSLGHSEKMINRAEYKQHLVNTIQWLAKKVY